MHAVESGHIEATDAGLYAFAQLALKDMDYSFTLLSERYDLLDAMNRIGGAAWPEFMLHDPVTLTHRMEIVDAFRNYQLMIMDGEEILAIVNTVPIEFSKSFTELPDEGVDSAFGEVAFGEVALGAGIGTALGAAAGTVLMMFRSRDSD